MQSSELSLFRPIEYSVSSVEKADAPEGAKGTGWYRYVISRQNSTIVGLRNGTLNQVSSYAREFAERLNERAAGGKTSHWSRSRGK